MEIESIKKNWQEAIMKGGLSSIFEDILRQLRKTSDAYNRCLFLATQNKEYEKRYNEGFLSNEHYESNKNKNTKAVLDLINNIKDYEFDVYRNNNIILKPNLEAIKKWIEAKTEALFFKMETIEIENNGLVRKNNIVFKNYWIGFDENILILVLNKSLEIERNLNPRVNKNIYDYRIEIPLDKIADIEVVEKKSKDYFLADKHSKDDLFFLSFSTLYEQDAIKVRIDEFRQVFNDGEIPEKNSAAKIELSNRFELLIPEKEIAYRLQKAFLELKSHFEYDELF